MHMRSFTNLLTLSINLINLKKKSGIFSPQLLIVLRTDPSKFEQFLYFKICLKIFSKFWKLKGNLSHTSVHDWRT